MRERPNRAFYASFLISVLFHLSMVTLFSIVIMFPREEAQFYSLRFVDEATRQPIFGTGRSAAFGPDRRVLRVPSLSEAIDPDVDSGEIAPMGDLDPLDLRSIAEGPDLPRIDIPQLEFAELSRLELRQESLRIRSAYGDLSSERPSDSWAWFGRELDQLRDTLRRLPGGPRTGSMDDDMPPPLPVSTPSTGFRAYVEWMGEPRERKLLFSPPIEALMRADRLILDEPIALVFKVNAQGRVVEVIDPLDDPGGVVSSAARALIKYRFEPVDDAIDAQYGTLIITADDPAP